MLQKAGEHDLSIKFNQQVVEMNTKMFGSNHPILNSAQESLVNAYCFKGDLRNALASQRQVYKIAKESYGIEDSRTIQSAEMLKGLTTKAVELAIQARSQKSEN